MMAKRKKKREEEKASGLASSSPFFLVRVILLEYAIKTLQKTPSSPSFLLPDCAYAACLAGGRCGGRTIYIKDFELLLRGLRCHLLYYTWKRWTSEKLSVVTAAAAAEAKLDAIHSFVDRRPV
jgi:hypothetical protein